MAEVIASSPAKTPGQSLTLLFVVIAVLPLVAVADQSKNRAASGAGIDSKPTSSTTR